MSNEKKDTHPPHKPPVVYNSEEWLVEKEERRRTASKMRKKMGKFEPIIETVSGEVKKASDLTYEEQQMEIIRCASDPIYFIETYLTIFDQTKGELVNGKPVGEIVPFKLFPFQRDLINSFINNRFVITNKYRQAGITTTTCAYIAWYIMFNENRSVALVANKLDTARDEIMHDVVTFIDNCPKWLKPKTGKAASKDEFKYKDTQKLKRYDNGSSIAAFSSTGLRGFSPTVVFWDEVAWTEKSDKFWTSAYPTLQTGGSAIMVSCVTKDSFIFTDKGIKTIGDFLDESNMGGYFVDDYSVLGKDKLRKGNIVFNNGFVDTLKIKTKFSEIETSLNHKFWAYKNGEYKWVEAKDLTLDDYVSIQKGMNIWGNNDDSSDFKPTESVYIKNVFNPKKITPDIAYLLGLYISEGYAKNIYNKNKTNIRSGRFVLSCGDCLDGILKKHNLTYHKEDVHYVVSSKNLNEFLEYLGFDITKKAKEKIIPPRLLEMSKENIVAMVQGIMDGDGWAMYNEKNNNITIGIGLSSPELIKQLRIIFNNFGVLTRFKYSLTKPTKKVKVYSHNYALVASGQNAEKYFEKIGFGFKRKNKIIEGYNKDIIKHSGTKDVIPNGCIILRELYQKVKRIGLFKELLKEDIDIKVYVTENRYKHKPIIKSKLLKFIDFVEKETGEKQNLDHIINENIVWVKVKEITKSQNYTYDFSLPSNPKEPNEFNHSIVYNQMITHQTPNGLDETFFKVFDGAKKGDNEFKAVELWWFNDPRYNQGLEWVKNKGQENEIRIKDENWSEERRIKLYTEDKWEATSPWFEKEVRNANGDMRKIAQEIQCSFLGSGDNFIAEKYLKRIEEYEIKPPIKQEYIDLNMWIWEDPIEGEDYYLSIDSSSGHGEDYSTINIFKTEETIADSVVKKGEKTKKVKIRKTKSYQVAEYYGKQAPQQLAELAYQYGKKYNDAYIICDVTGGYGVQVLERLFDMGCENIHHSEVTHKPTRDRLQGYIKQGNKTLADGSVVVVDLIPGFFIGNNRASVLLEMQSAIHNEAVVIRSRRLSTELKTFVTVPGNRVADHRRTFHDDSIMGMATFLYVLAYDKERYKQSKVTTEKMLNSMITNNEVDDMIRKRPDYKPFIKNNNIDPNNPYYINRWLFTNLKH